MTKKRVGLIAVAVLLATSLVATPVAAAPGGPVLHYLQSRIHPLLEATHNAVVGLQSALGSLPSSIAQLLTTTAEVDSVVVSQPRLHVVKTSLTTSPDGVAILNLDQESLPVGPLEKIKKYSVTLRVQADLSGVPAGVDRIQVVNGVFDGVATTYDMTVAELDPTASGAVALLPYAGTNSFIRVSRGADGLGPFDVLVNAYIESEP